MIPEKIDRYEIKSEIGRGGMATVYRAYDPRSKREVAVKVLPRELLHSPTFRARFQREAEVIAALEHPAIVPVYDFGEEDGQPYFVMRLMNGGSLADRLQKGPLPIDEAIRIFNHLAPALDRAHSKEIVHRDLKPDNILFDDDGNPYISDFGIAKLAQSNVSMTGSGVVGTPAYMSPEQARGDEKIDARSDTYALGAILFQTLTGHFPYKASTPMGVVVKHITDPVPLILSVKSDLPAECEDLIQRAMAKDREERFQTASEMAAALTMISSGKPHLADTPAVTQITPSRIEQSDTISVPVSQPITKGKTNIRLVGGIVATVVVIAAIIGAVVTVRANSAAQQTATTGAIAAVNATTGDQQTGTAVALLDAAASATAQQLAAEVTVASPTATATATATVTATASATPLPTAIPIGGGAGRIVFISKRDGNNEVYMMNVDGTDPTRLTDNPANDSFPVWSPDGKQIAFFTNRDGNNELYVMAADGSNLTRLTNNTFSDYNPAWSPDGKQIAFISDRDGNNRVYAINANGSGDKILTDNPAGHESPAWSPDGTKITFSTNRDGNYEIYVMDADGSSPTRLTDNPADDSFPVWSPDGKQILFTSKRDGNYELYMISADGANPVRLTNNSADDSFPAWSPDGTKIAFTSFRDGNPEIYLINASGSGTTRLTDNPASDFSSSWQP